MHTIQMKLDEILQIFHYLDRRKTKKILLATNKYIIYSRRPFPLVNKLNMSAMFIIYFILLSCDNM